MMCVCDLMCVWCDVCVVRYVLCIVYCVFIFHLRHLFPSMLRYSGVILHALLVIYIFFSICSIYILEP